MLEVAGMRPEARQGSVLGQDPRQGDWGLWWVGAGGGEAGVDTRPLTSHLASQGPTWAGDHSFLCK